LSYKSKKGSKEGSKIYSPKITVKSIMSFHVISSVIGLFLPAFDKVVRGRGRGRGAR
jgi:hypothetical protein